MPSGVRDVQRVCDRCAECASEASSGRDASAAECACYAWCTDYVAICSVDTGTFAGARARTCTSPCSSCSICGCRCAVDGRRAHF